MLLSIIFLCSTLAFAQAQVTIYEQIALLTETNIPNATSTATTAITTPTGPAYDDTVLTPPLISSPPPLSDFTLTLAENSNAVQGLSMPHLGGSFWGFSIEMSVISQLLGKNSSYIEPPFLNLMSNIVERSGSVQIRLGGNTQETAALVAIGSIANGSTFSKAPGTAQTPAVVYTVDMFYMLSNISSLVNVKWFLGVPFNDSVNWRLAIAEQGQQIMGDKLLGLQAGNEPDFYATFGTRPVTYSPLDYSSDFGSLVAAIDADAGIPNKNMLIGPSVATGPWTPEDVWNTGFIQTYGPHLFALSVEHYPNNNCAATSATPGPIVVPQTVFPSYITHSAAIDLVQPYLNSTTIALQAGKPFYMFETNSASCGGFAGISDTYGAALWAIDYGMQLAYGNFSHGMLHTGGQNSYYNVFTAPPGNESKSLEWTVGAIYYSAIVLAEAFGMTNTSQIIDLGANAQNNFTPAYAIYEQGHLSKVALINFMDDSQTPTAANNLQVTLQVPNGAVPSVEVKYLSAASVSSRDNITWAGQTLGNDFTVNGLFNGTLNVVSINCNASTCVIPVPAPGFALVFLDNPASPSFADPYLTLSQATQTFSTSTLISKTTTTATPITTSIPPAVLATSNGHSGVTREVLGSTSQENDAEGGMRAGVSVLVGLFAGALLLLG